ncbi:hypothetical protein EB796_016691 [Bugula neritina]|uniref:Uncharacterized protein n=1 Tax=Bugula neritina TaxID=10212 RepID=A0A7J7JFK3_BUGNE|nr:hypothetical protein EB796_016691 [Bugula neritina]
MFEEDDLCPYDKLFNIDLCECWSNHTVEQQTCRTKPGYDVSQLKQESLAGRNRTSKKLLEHKCALPDSSGFNRSVFYYQLSEDLCKQEFMIRVYEDNGKQTNRYHQCGKNKLLNFDSCDCAERSVVNEQTCFTKTELPVEHSTFQQKKGSNDSDHN